MSHLIRMGCVALCLFATTPSFSAAEPRGSVSVEFLQPESFTDVRDRQFASAPDKNPNLHQLRRYLEKRALRYLSDGQRLKITFTDIDLAGDHRAQTNPALNDVRLVTSLYPPRLKFNFELQDDSGAVLKSGEVKLLDLGFDTFSAGIGSEPLRYEQRMLDKWLRQEIRGS